MNPEASTQTPDLLDTAPLPPMSERRLGHYRLLSLLGKGGMGEVYLAEDTQLERKVALKVLPAAFTDDADRVRRFAREAKAASALNHPNILTIYEIGHEQNTHYIATEYIAGETLRQRLTREKSSLQAALDIAIQIASALAAAHEAGIIHRDIKPENVMLRKDGLVKVLDFGLAKLVETRKAERGAQNEEAETLIQADAEIPRSSFRDHHSTEPGTVMGTASYMSPEQARGQDVDARSDIFSLGVLLFEMLAGRAPFAGVNALDVIGAILHQEPAPLNTHTPDVPAELQRIVTKAVRKERDERYQTAKDLLLDVKNLQQELDFAARLKGVQNSDAAAAAMPSTESTTQEVTTAPTTSSAKIILSEIKRHKTGVMLALAVVILVILGGAYLAWRVLQPAKQAGAHFQQIRFTRVTNEGNVESATITPDGKYIAYTLEQDGKRSVWTKHLATGSRVQITPPVEAPEMNANIFSPDGSYVYYLVVNEQYQTGALFQAPILGGASKLVLTDINAPITLSPDGRQFAFTRLKFNPTQTSLYIANLDGTNARFLLASDKTTFLLGYGAAWSPDGKWLAISYGNYEGGEHMEVAVVAVADGALKRIPSQLWWRVGRIAWLGDGSGLVVVAEEKQAQGANQLWQVSWPQGEAQRVTNDLNSYGRRSLTCTADSRALIAVQDEITSNIWIAPGGETSRARIVATRKNILDGRTGLTWTPDGKIMYDLSSNGKRSIWVMNADGSQLQAVTDGSTAEAAPEVTPDGRSIVFKSLRTGFFQVWRMNADTSQPQQLTEGTGVETFSVSPDGRWVIYVPYAGGIWKVPLAGGSPIEIVSQVRPSYPQVSPDGRLLAYKPGANLIIIPFEGGAPVYTFKLPITVSRGIYNHDFRWSPDGRAIDYIKTQSGVSNLWRQPLDGSPPKQITDFKSDLIWNFAWSWDGKQLALARGTQTRDAVLISEVK